MSNQQKALLLPSPGGALVLGTRPIPEPAADEVLVKIESTAINPIDHIIQDFSVDVASVMQLSYPAVIGFDSAGVVAGVGSNVKHLKVGDKVFHIGFHGSNDKATFQEYTIVPEEIVAKIPDNISFDQAATLSTTLTTAAVGLYNTKTNATGAGLYPPWEEGGIGKYTGKPIIVFGGASSVGLYTIQLAKLSGFSPIIATASDNSKDLLTRIGATHILSRNLPSSKLASAITEITKGVPLEIIYDAVSVPETQQLGWDLVADGGSLVVVMPPNMDKKGQESKKQLIHVYCNVHAPQNRDLGRKLYARITDWLKTGIIVPNKFEVLPNGLLGVDEGFLRLRRKQVSGKKLVVRLQDTP